MREVCGRRRKDGQQGRDGRGTESIRCVGNNLGTMKWGCAARALVAGHKPPIFSDVPTCGPLQHRSGSRVQQRSYGGK